MKTKMTREKSKRRKKEREWDECNDLFEESYGIDLSSWVCDSITRQQQGGRPRSLQPVVVDLTRESDSSSDESDSSKPSSSSINRHLLVPKLELVPDLTIDQWVAAKRAVAYKSIDFTSPARRDSGRSTTPGDEPDSAGKTLEEDESAEAADLIMVVQERAAMTDSPMSPVTRDDELLLAGRH